MNTVLNSKNFNILSFVFLLLSIVVYICARQGIFASYWILVMLFAALLSRMYSFQLKVKELKKENTELKEDLKNLTRILKEKITDEK